jgi:hypothetical protein
MLILLSSVNTWLDVNTLKAYPCLPDGEPDYCQETDIVYLEADPEWWNELSDRDALILTKTIIEYTEQTEIQILEIPEL